MGDKKSNKTGKKQKAVKICKICIFTLISILLLWLLFRYTSINQIIQGFSELTLKAFLLGLLFYIIGYWIRAARFYYLLEKKLKPGLLFFIVCMHNAFNSLLPARLGEISYLYFVKKKNIDIPKGAASLVLARIFDLTAVILLFLLAAAMVWKTLPEFFIDLTPYIIGLLGILVIFVVLFVIFSSRIINWLGKKFKNRFLLKSLQKINEFVRHFKHGSRKKLAMLFFTSILLWVSQFLMIYFIFVDVLGLNFWYILMGSLFPILSTVLPVQGMAGFGSIEGAWALAFIALGVAKELAIASGFVFHIVIMAYFIPLGVIGWIGWRIRK